MQNPISIYIHVPFCGVKCSYCAFNVYTHLDHLIVPFVDALVKEIHYIGQTAPETPVHTVYFGGGTPSLLSPAQFEMILNAVAQAFTLTEDVHVSTEANPNDLTDVTYISALRAAGISRLSIGVQSTIQSELEMFQRLHDVPMIFQAVENARQANIEDINLDLIFGTPGQTLAMWKTTLDTILDLTPNHLSLYGLEVEPETAMDAWISAGRLSEPDDDLAADMYDYASERLERAGFRHYEISNWALPGYESRHNLQYWKNWDYIGLGPGAHGYAGRTRYATIRSPHRYIQSMRQPVPDMLPYPRTPTTDTWNKIDQAEAIAETIMMGMRLVEDGINLAGFQSRFGVSLLDIRQDVIEAYRQQGMVEITDGVLRLTRDGWLISNRILRDLV